MQHMVKNIFERDEMEPQKENPGLREQPGVTQQLEKETKMSNPGEVIV